MYAARRTGSKQTQRTDDGELNHARALHGRLCDALLRMQTQRCGLDLSTMCRFSSYISDGWLFCLTHCATGVGGGIGVERAARSTHLACLCANVRVRVCAFARAREAVLVSVSMYVCMYTRPRLAESPRLQKVACVFV